MTVHDFKRRYVIVTPVRDEAARIAGTIESVIRQTIRPREWVIVDDGSTDQTAAILDRYAAQESWIRVVHRPDRGRRQNGAGVMQAFHAGLRVLSGGPWDYLVKLDGDLTFAPDYFERCLAMFEHDPRLGIGGGVVCRLERGTLQIDSIGDPPFHVRGATKIYRRACWDAIGPLVSAPGWDTIDEVKANLNGWTTRTFGAIPVVQHKPTGGADGRWRNAFKNGRANYVAGYHPVFMLGKCVRRSLRPPVVLGSLALLAGFLSGYVKGVPRGADRAVIEYLREQQIRRVLNRPSIYAG